MSSRHILRFILSEADYARVNLATLEVAEITSWPNPLRALRPPPGTLRIRFKLTDVNGPAPQVIPLFPGALTYRHDPDLYGDTALPRASDFPGTAPGDFGQWAVQGIISVTANEPSNYVRALFPGPEHWPDFVPVPNVAWYYPVELTNSFLSTTIAPPGVTGSPSPGLDPLPIVLPLVSADPIPVDDDNWWKHALAGFFRGEYRPDLTIGSSPGDDAVQRCEMPSLVKVDPTKYPEERDARPDWSDWYELFVSFAYRPRLMSLDASTQPHLQDGPVSSLDEISSSLWQHLPLHDLNGAIPAWYLYSRAVGQYVDSSHDAMQAMFASKLGHRRYFPVRFTRTWLPVENMSQYFPNTTITVAVGSQPAKEERIPVHGVLFLSDTGDPNDPNIPMPHANIDVDKTKLRLLRVSHVEDGVPMVEVGPETHVPAWRAPEPPIPAPETRSRLIDVPLSVDTPVHLLARRPMSEALFTDIEGFIELVRYNVRPNLPAEYRAPGRYCTYFSLHRVLRALVDNRILGGRLNYPPLSIAYDTTIGHERPAQHSVEVEESNWKMIASAYSTGAYVHGTNHSLVRLFDRHGPHRRPSQDVVNATTELDPKQAPAPRRAEPGGTHAGVTAA